MLGDKILYMRVTSTLSRSALSWGQNKKKTWRASTLNVWEPDKEKEVCNVCPQINFTKCSKTQIINIRGTKRSKIETRTIWCIFSCIFPHRLYSQLLYILHIYVYTFIKKELQKDTPTDESSDCLWGSLQGTGVVGGNLGFSYSIWVCFLQQEYMRELLI